MFLLSVADKQQMLKAILYTIVIYCDNTYSAIGWT